MFSCSGGQKVMKCCRFQAKCLIFNEPFIVFSTLRSKIAKMTPRGFIRPSQSHFGVVFEPFLSHLGAIFDIDIDNEASKTTVNTAKNR